MSDSLLKILINNLCKSSNGTKKMTKDKGEHTITIDIITIYDHKSYLLLIRVYELAVKLNYKLFIKKLNVGSMNMEDTLKFPPIINELVLLTDFDQKIIIPKLVKCLHIGIKFSKSIIIPNSVVELHITSIKAQPFVVPRSVKNLVICNSTYKFVIPSSIIELDIYHACSLNKLYLPNTIEKIDYYECAHKIIECCNNKYLVVKN